MSQQQTYQSHLFRSFKAIGADSYRSILRFVEDNSTDIRLLPVAEYFDLQYAYVSALYETGGYQRVVNLTKELLELSIIHNLFDVEGEDAYRSLLFKRANSLFYLMEYEECLHVCDQLLRLYPRYTAAALLYEKALYQKPNPWIARGRALSVVLFLMAAGLIAFEVLVLAYLLNTEANAWVTFVRNLSFVLGWCLLLGGDIGHRAWAWWRVRNFQRRYKANRSLD